MPEFKFVLPNGWSYRQRPDIDAYQFYMTEDPSVFFDVTGPSLARMNDDLPGFIRGIRAQMSSAQLRKLAKESKPSVTERGSATRRVDKDETIKPILLGETAPLTELLSRPPTRRKARTVSGRPIPCTTPAYCKWRAKDQSYKGLGGKMPCEMCGNLIGYDEMCDIGKASAETEIGSPAGSVVFNMAGGLERVP